NAVLLSGRRKTMRLQNTYSYPLSPRAGAMAASIIVVFYAAILSAAEPAGPKASASADLALGRELFLREWVPNDPRSHGGDGLGPVFNDSSCVACHNQGGPGGGGPASKNVDLLSAFPDDESKEAQAKRVNHERQFLWNAARALVGLPLSTNP